MERFLLFNQVFALFQTVYKTINSKANSPYLSISDEFIFIGESDNARALELDAFFLTVFIVVP